MKIMKYIAYLTALFLIVGAAYLGNLFFMKPLSIDHYLAKNLIIDYAEAPEGLTYIGIIDRFNWFNDPWWFNRRENLYNVIKKTINFIYKS